ncbi:unnamed protein product [Miscanthus lutarioriparius]|uniref:Uncharacterized protein n=1 Tax=Miscanthus lutarioriparius TaxID=422564 RepID=A0A811Q7Q2_9POAL|nr:unnamed protein product [Miscanthus lutarioriparius]
MGYVLSAVARVLELPTAWGAAWEMALLAGPLWAAALLGLLLGWAWRPRWAAGLVVATADGGSAAAAAAQAPAQPPFATLDFWKAHLPPVSAPRSATPAPLCSRGRTTRTPCKGM